LFDFEPRCVRNHDRGKNKKNQPRHRAQKRRPGVTNSLED
jgi:hypothetical protein